MKPDPQDLYCECMNINEGRLFLFLSCVALHPSPPLVVATRPSHAPAHARSNALRPQAPAPSAARLARERRRCRSNRGAPATHATRSIAAGREIDRPSSASACRLPDRVSHHRLPAICPRVLYFVRALDFAMWWIYFGNHSSSLVSG